MAQTKLITENLQGREGDRSVLNPALPPSPASPEAARLCTPPPKSGAENDKVQLVLGVSSELLLRLETSSGTRPLSRLMELPEAGGQLLSAAQDAHLARGEIEARLAENHTARVKAPAAFYSFHVAWRVLCYLLMVGTG